MSEISTGRQTGAGRYEFRLQGHLDSRWTSWFDGLTVTNESDGITVICGDVADQAALHGLISKVRNIGIPLISVIQVGPARADLTAINPNKSSIEQKEELT